MVKHYAKRDYMAQGRHYLAHVEAMTAEDLYAKSAIAAELAHRDTQIDALASENERLRDDAHRYRWLRKRLEFVDTKKIDNMLSAGVNGCLDRYIDIAIDAEMRGGSTHPAQGGVKR